MRSTLVVAVFLIAEAALFSRPSAQIQLCSTEIVRYPERNRIQTPIFSLDLTAPNGGRLVYIGARHSNDPTDPQFLDIKKAWDDLRPTVAFYEGAGIQMWSTTEQAIREAGEPGLVQFLAEKDSIRSISLEPSEQDEATYLLTKFNPEQVKLFYTLRVVSEMRQRQNRSEPELRLAAINVMQRLSKLKGLENVVRTIEELEAAYRHYWSKPGNWSDAPRDWFNPLKSSSETEGVFTNEINQESSTFRDVNMYSALTTAVLERKRVFAVVGRDHVPMQALALKCALQ
jgi:hypothetical protein